MSYYGGGGGYGATFGEGSGYLQGDTTDPAMQSTEGFINAQQKVKQANDVDTAIRTGVGNMMASGGSTYYKAPQAGGDYQPPLMPPNVGTPTPSNGPSVPIVPASYPSSGAQPSGTFNASIASTEKPLPGEPPTNSGGYGGKYQFGQDALNDIGFYKYGPGETPGGKNTWGGQITVPGQPPMTPQQFWQNEQAQDTAMNARHGWLNNWLVQTGLARHSGETIDGVPMTMDTMAKLAEFAGPGNFQRWLTTGGAFPFKDGNDVTIPQMAERLANGGGSSGPPTGASNPGQSIGTNGAAPGFTTAGYDPTFGAGQTQGGSVFGSNPSFNARYDPILTELAKTPGGGAQALQIMGQQTRYDMGMLKRQDVYARLAMQAAAKGDLAMLQQFSGMGGLKIPPQLMQNAGAMQRFGQASLIAERMYGPDRAGASRFVNGYMQTGDINQAYQIAGPPLNAQHITPEWFYDQATQTLRLAGVQTGGPGAAGQVTQLTMPGATPGAPAQPAVSSVKPSGALQAAEYRHDNPNPVGPHDLLTTYNSLYATTLRDPSGNATPASAQAEAERIMDRTYPGWREQVGGHQAAPAPAAAAEAPAQSPAPAAPAPPPPAGASPNQSDQMPPAALAKLKEGVRTHFGNGQTWTLRHGVPTQVNDTPLPLTAPGAAGM